jgi:protoheme IX farnesyltransferase
MLAATRMVVSLLKLRIGVAIAASALAGIAVAEGIVPSALSVAALAIAVIGASGAAGAFNHYYERDLDQLMVRTRNRPFASGALSPGMIWPASFLVLLAASLVLAYLAGGSLAALFVFLGAFTYGIVYTVWLKRRSAMNIVVGGLAGSFAVLAGAAAVDTVPQANAWILALVLFLWTPPHFWSLAAAKGDDYRTAGVPMLPTVVSQHSWSLIILAHTVALVLVSLLPLFFGAGLFYGLGAGIGGAIFLTRSWQLYRLPSKKAAMANFFASLQQLMALVTGACLEALLGSPL